mgnify:CR=1 FL=1
MKMVVVVMKLQIALVNVVVLQSLMNVMYVMVMV